MKKFGIFVIAIVMVLSLANTGVIAVNTQDDSTPSAESHEEMLLISDIKNMIVEFYENKDLGYQNDLSKKMDQPIKAYLDDKASTHQYVIELYGTQKENYKVNVDLLEKSCAGNTASFQFKVNLTYNLIGLSDTKTTVNEVVEVVYDINRNLITDFYTPYNYYDMYVRDEDYDDQGVNSTQQSFVVGNVTTSRQESLRAKIDEVYEAEVVNAPLNNTPSLRFSYLNSSNIVSYARDNYYKAQPDSGNGSVTYYDFSEISGNWDCTNFVSHALLAGGANVYDTGGSGISGTGWYYRNINDRSSSWSSVNALYNFLTTNTKSNTPRGISQMYSTNTGAWGTGDVMQFQDPSDGVWWHSTIITVKNYSSDGARAYALVTGRTNDYSNNDNQPAEEIYPGGYKRTIFVYNQ